jgi:hypothetical protein
MLKQLGDALGQIVDTVGDPKAAMRRISVGSVPWLLVAAIVCAAALLIQYTSTQLVVGANASLSRWFLYQVLATPLIFAARVTLIATAVWCGAIVVRVDIDFLRCLILTICAQTIVVLHEATLVTIDKLSRSPLTAQEIGLNLLVRQHGAIAHIAAVLNPFSLWYIILLSVGIAVCGRTSLKRGLLALTPYMILFITAKLGEVYFMTMRGL